MLWPSRLLQSFFCMLARPLSGPLLPTARLCLGRLPLRPVGLHALADGLPGGSRLGVATRRNLPLLSWVVTLCVLTMATTENSGRKDMEKRPFLCHYQQHTSHNERSEDEGLEHSDPIGGRALYGGYAGGRAWRRLGAVARPELKRKRTGCPQ